MKNLDGLGSRLHYNTIAQDSNYQSLEQYLPVIRKSIIEDICHNRSPLEYKIQHTNLGRVFSTVFSGLGFGNFITGKIPKSGNNPYVHLYNEELVQWANDESLEILTSYDVDRDGVDHIITIKVIVKYV